MEKLKKRINVNYEFDWEYGAGERHGVEINKIRKDLDALEKIGATHIEIDSFENYGCSILEIRGVCERFETDQELEERLNRLKIQEQKTKESEIALFEELKKKFEKLN